MVLLRSWDDGRLGGGCPVLQAAHFFATYWLGLDSNGPLLNHKSKAFRYLVMILKTYARFFTQDVAASLLLFEQLVGRKPDIHFVFGEWEIVAIGDILLVGGTEETLAPIRGSSGPLVVDDLIRTQQLLEEAGAVITQPIRATPTGTMLYARHPDGSSVEYVQWLPELVKRIIG